MFFRFVKLILPLTLFVVLAGCDNESVYSRDGNFRLKDAGPDEFAVVPTKELELPENTQELPEPVLGAKNRVDATPRRDAIAALGGKPDRLDSQQIGGGEQPLITAASRYGVSANIRQTLAVEDAEYRRKNRARFTQRWYEDQSYLRRFRNESLEPYNELSRMRGMGVRTPTAPLEE